MIKDIDKFIKALSGSDPVPGGGGASAVTASIGTALAGMVASLTLKSKKHESVRDEMSEIKIKTDVLQKRLLELVDADAAAFEPLAQAYKIPKDDPVRDAVMEEALIRACTPPLDIMAACEETLALFPVLREKGTKMAVSDTDAGEVLCKAAMRAASYNVFINTGMLKNRDEAEKLNKRAQEMMDKWNC